MKLNALILLVFASLWLNGISIKTQAAVEKAPPEPCEALADVDFSVIEDAPTQIIGAAVVEAKDKAHSYCRVRGYVAPQVGFELHLPVTRWNEKFIELGCGGACGTTDHVAACEDPLLRGYACGVSDGGHTSSGLDVKWAYNNPQAVINYLVSASHVTAIAEKSIVDRYYGKTPKRSYFMGCSAGGLQATVAAERFPHDYDGIAAGSPCLRGTAQLLNYIWNNRAMTDKDGGTLLRQTDLDLLHRAVVAKCDLIDGVRDGLIGDPRLCHFDPLELMCAGGKQESCLTAKQIEAVKKIYRGPTASDGRQLAPPIAMMGSESTWLVDYGGSSAHPTPFFNYLGDWIRYYSFQPNPGPKWTLDNFDFDHDPNRLGMAALVEPFNDPDLRQFKAAGAKLLMYTGWDDSEEGVLNTVDYYETVERVMRGRTQTQAFFRLFVVPGGAHCEGGEGAFTVDYLSYLERWVEQGIAPDKLLGSHVDESAEPPHFPLSRAQIQFSRPIYPYPIVARYSGHGDPADASSFVPVSP